ncbi:unnamed protein product [Orchesella dallaii]|uniref:Secreted protein n=1 Tax=Orchesella dallaii TaxID=48710 RepID=A0ABP1PWT9_9HEXA
MSALAAGSAGSVTSLTILPLTSLSVKTVSLPSLSVLIVLFRLCDKSVCSNSGGGTRLGLMEDSGERKSRFHQLRSRVGILGTPVTENRCSGFM